MSLVAPPLQAQDIAWEEPSHRRTRANVKPLLSQRNVACRCRKPLKRPRLSRPAVAAPVEPINTAASSSSESDSEDEELQKAMALSLEETKTPEIDEEERQLQEAMRLSLESTPSSQGNPSPQRFARLSAANSVLVALQGSFAALKNVRHMHQKNQIYGIQRLELEVCKSRRFEVPKPNLKHVVTFELHAENIAAREPEFVTPIQSNQTYSRNTECKGLW